MRACVCMLVRVCVCRFSAAGMRGGGGTRSGGVHAAGIYRALHLSGAIADMERRGVDCVHAFAVDNAVCRVADPVFLGYCLGRDADVGNKVRVCVHARRARASLPVQRRQRARRLDGVGVGVPEDGPR
jgi:hypothetical protein